MTNYLDTITPRMKEIVRRRDASEPLTKEESIAYGLVMIGKTAVAAAEGNREGDPNTKRLNIMTFETIASASAAAVALLLDEDKPQAKTEGVHLDPKDAGLAQLPELPFLTQGISGQYWLIVGVSAKNDMHGYKQCIGYPVINNLTGRRAREELRASQLVAMFGYTDKDGVHYASPRQHPNGRLHTLDKDTVRSAFIDNRIPA